ncbi:glutathione S-transferase [Rhodobacteraceae bacterium KMM 6894]|nr:glutathione S-transferase [Rhodobacteraceae bacterium KMM 6894]
MKLISAKPSPFGRKVNVLLHETGQLDKVEVVASAPSPVVPDSSITSVNPLGKIPALIRDSGPALYDSRVICRYLDAQADAGLYPEARLWDVLTLEATADGIMDAAILMVYEGRARPEDKQHQPWVDGQWMKVAGSVDALESRWLSHLAGPLDMGQIAVACALSYLDFRHGDRDWRTGHPGLAAWHAAFEARPSMQATRPD